MFTDFRVKIQGEDLKESGQRPRIPGICSEIRVNLMVRSSRWRRPNLCLWFKI